jgi:hypothetical protein
LIILQENAIKAEEEKMPQTGEEKGGCEVIKNVPPCFCGMNVIGGTPIITTVK